MKRLSRLLKNLQDYDAQAVIVDVVANNKKPLIEANQKQLTDGIKTDGSGITPPYSSRYAQQRRAKGLQVGHVDLKVTGALYRGLDYNVTNKETTFFTSVEYGKYHTGRYVQQIKGHIYGVTNENLKQAFDSFYKDLILKETKKHIFNGL